MSTDHQSVCCSNRGICTRFLKAWSPSRIVVWVPWVWRRQSSEGASQFRRTPRPTWGSVQYDLSAWDSLELRFPAQFKCAHDKCQVDFFRNVLTYHDKVFFRILSRFARWKQKKEWKIRSIKQCRENTPRQWRHLKPRLPDWQWSPALKAAR